MKTDQTNVPSPAPGLARFCSSLNDRSPLATAAVHGPLHLIAYSNPALSRLLDRSTAALLGKSFCQITHMSDDCVGLFDRVYRTGESASHTEHDGSKPDSAFWAYTLWPVMIGRQAVGIMIQLADATQIHAKMIAMNEALVVGAVRQDELIEAAASSNAQLRDEIVARKQTEEVLRRARVQLADRAGQLEQAVAERTAELTAINKQLDAFVYTVAHDLRAPLRSMQGFSSLLVEDAGNSLSETGRDYANRIIDSAQFMDSLLLDLIAFSRIAKEKIPLEPIDLRTIANWVIVRLDDLIRQTNAAVEIAEQSYTVMAHGPTLGQVLTNLICNALKFSRPGVPPALRVRFEEQSRYIRVWVEDNGLGIPKDQCVKIFQLFTRLNTGNSSGTGIGLAIVAKGIERMEGFLGVDSVVGEGSRFWFELKKP
jgi:signal transduction histidine kinase